MALSETGHPPDDVDKTTGHNESNKRPKATGPVRWTIGVVVRLCIWYALLIPFFRCPSQLSDLNESSPRVCKPYLVARSHLEPHFLPYYHIYAAPYVDSARPYVSVINEQVYSPAAKLTKESYDKYGAPAWDQVQAYGQEQWDAQVAPRLQAAQDRIIGVYMSELDPYVQRAVLVVTPYYEKANAVLTSTYGDYIIPLYAQTTPIIGKTYTSGQEILTTTILPHAQSSWSSVIYFANSSLWPKVTGLYSENVEPQLVKIGQRLASYREGNKLRTSVEDVDSTSEEVAYSAGSASTDASHASVAPTTASTTEAPSPQATLSPTEQLAQAREKITSDLETWQKKFAVAAERGAEDLVERVEDIVGSHIASGAKSHGESLATALDTIVAGKLSTIKSRINSLAESLPYQDAPEEEAKAQDELVKDIKSAAITIRERAQAMREWHSSFDEELVHRVSAAINSTLDILDSVRDLGLQEIGMRWAWMDDVTYKDWAKYHSLKAQFDDYRRDVNRIGMQHGKVEEARAMANDLVARGMEIAENTAKDLARLRDVGKWKIAAREASDDFNIRSGPPPALPKNAESDSFADGDISHTDSPSSESSSEPEELDDAASAAVFPDTKADDQISTDQDPSYQDDELLAGQESDGAVAQDPGQTETAKSAPIWGVAAAEIAPEESPMQQDTPDDGTQKRSSEQETPTANPLDYISSVASSRMSEGLSAASAEMARVHATVLPAATSGQDVIVLDAQRRYYEAIGLARDHYSAFVSTASGAVYGSPAPTPPPGPLQEFIGDPMGAYSQQSSLASASLAAVVSSASSAINPTNPGKAQEVIGDASSRYSAAISRAKDLVNSAIWETPTGQVEALASKASENWEGLVSEASEQVYGTHDIYAAPASVLSSASSYASNAATHLPAVEDILESASKQFDHAIGAASVQIYGTSKGPLEQATSAAGSAFASASIHAYASVTSAAGEQQKVLESASNKLGDAVGSAEAQLAKLASSASSFTDGVKSTPSSKDEL